VSAKSVWDCTKSGKYQQRCTNTLTGYTMTVKIKPGYKAACIAI
jgi:hypothetical protein